MKKGRGQRAPNHSSQIALQFKLSLCLHEQSFSFQSVGTHLCSTLAVLSCREQWTGGRQGSEACL